MYHRISETLKITSPGPGPGAGPGPGGPWTSGWTKPKVESKEVSLRVSVDVAAEGSRRVELRYQRECSLGCTRALSLAVIEQGMTCLAESEELYQPNADRFSYGRRMFDLKVDESASISKRRAGW